MKSHDPTFRQRAAYTRVAYVPVSRTLADLRSVCPTIEPIALCESLAKSGRMRLMPGHDVQPFSSSTAAPKKSLLVLVVVIDLAAVVAGVVADSQEHGGSGNSWFIRVATVTVAVAVGYAIGWKGHSAPIWQVLVSLMIVFVIGLAMLNGTITLWLGFTALMSAALGAAVRQLRDVRSRR